MEQEILDFLKERAESHNKRYGHLPSKHCEYDVLVAIWNRHKNYCKLFDIKSKSKSNSIFKRRIQDYMRVLRTGFVKEVIDTLVWEDLELLPEGHRMRPPYKISVYA